MFKTSHNVLFVYSLLLIDLLVNISDNLIPAPSYLARNVTNNELELIISPWTFTIFIIQIIAIICVVIDLVVYFFNVSDQVKQIACLLIESEAQIGATPSNEALQKSDHQASNEPAQVQWATQTQSQPNCRQAQQQIIPMPQRVALKLVLDKYWWSLLVGLIYLVLTIILQIVRLDPSWHHNQAHLMQQASKAGQPLASENLIQLDTSPDLMFALFGKQDADKPAAAETRVGPGSLLADQREDRGNLLAADSSLHEDLQLIAGNNHRGPNRDANMSLVPVLIVLIHKLMSTCYYVSFVVVYRATTSQMVNRILFINGKHHQQQHQVSQPERQSNSMPNTNAKRCN